MSALTIRPVETRQALRTFIYLPAELYKNRPTWVPPLYADEWVFFDPKRNPAYALADTALWLAYLDDQPVGRIMGIVHREYNQTHTLSQARFSHFDCLNDGTIAHLLLSTVTEWAKNKGMQSLIGPFGFSEKDPQGAKIEGFEYLPVIATASNPPYLPALLEAEGFDKLTDCVVYKIDIPPTIPALYEQVAERIARHSELRLLEFESRRQLKPYIVPVFELVNQTYRDLLGFVPLNEAEIQKIAKAYLPILDPQFVKLVVDPHNQPIAFVVALPDMSVGIQRAKGQLFPFGFLYLLWAARRTKQLDLLLGAVHPQHRSKGLTALLGLSLLRSAHKRGLQFIDTHLILEDNHAMRAEAERLKGQVYKRYRIYQKNI